MIDGHLRLDDACRAMLLLPLHAEYLEGEVLQLPSFDVNRSAAANPLRNKVPLDQKPAKCKQKIPWAVFVCIGKEKEGVGFSQHDMVLLREWGRLFRTSFQTAGLLL
jgi:hypothetical protein